MCKPTSEMFSTLQAAYDFFNAELWNNELPPCMILIHRKKGANGYYWPAQFAAKGKQQMDVDEIALTPDSLRRDDRAAISTLVHEMAHHWQHHNGTPGRRGYHNAEWAAEMCRIGLTPTDTGTPEGKQTGQKVTHMIDDGGAYDRAFQKWSRKHTLNFAGQEQPETEAATKSKASKTKFTCPECSQNAWAKPEALLVCGCCMVESKQAILMEAAA